MTKRWMSLGLAALGALGLIVLVVVAILATGTTPRTVNFTMSPMVLTPAERDVIESGDDEAADALMSTWIETSLRDYFDNLIGYRDQMDAVPSDSIAESDNAAIVVALKDWVRNHYDEDEGPYGICPELEANDRFCFVNLEPVESDINIVPTEENYDAMFGILVTGGPLVTSQQIIIGNGDGSSLQMYVTDDGELKTR